MKVEEREMQSGDKCKTQLKSCLKVEERSATKTCKIEEENIRNLNAKKKIQQQWKVLWEWSKERQTKLQKQDKNIIKIKKINATKKQLWNRMTNLLWEKVKEVGALYVKLNVVQKEKILSSMMMVLQLPTFNVSSWIEMKSWRLLA